MEVALTTIGGAILSAAFQALFDKLGSHDLLTYAREGQVIHDLKKWEIMLKKIYLVLNDAEEKQMANPLVKMWVSELRDLAYDVEDILDEFSTEVLRRKLEGEPVQEARTSKVKKLLIPTCCGRLSFNTVKFNAQMISKIKEITARFDDIMKQKDLLRLVEGDSGRGSNQIRERLHTTCLVEEAEVCGRKKDKEAILEILKAVETKANVSVVPIVGMGGVGKTTLAQLIFNDAKLEEFDLKSWVSVGEDFDVVRMTKTILQQESTDDKDLNSLQLKLKEKLSRKKFFIVLDDVWTENYEDWTHFRAPFTMGKPGSTLLITTRSENVSSMMGTISAYPLKELSNDDCMSVFAQHALGATDFGEHMDLKEIGMRIVNKCKGLPLAAKALGGLLRGKLNAIVWEDVLISEIWDLPEDKSNVFPALRLSYFHLPSHLKQCFAYCAIFPKDYEFDKNQLVLLWMAEGFLSQPKKMKPMQDLGCQYFDDLLFRSFFQRSNSNKSRYVMHDLMNDLARYVGKEICFRLDDKFGDENSAAKIRHLSFIRHRREISQKFEGFSSINNLRTFLPLPIMSDWFLYYHLSSKVMHDLVPKLKCLRVLSVAGYVNILELPSSIGALKHLRYLNLSHTKIKRLPESVGELLNLQTLLLCNCWELEELFSGISNLINLQGLDISGTDELKEMPLQVGNLRNLHTLTKFIVGRKNGLKLNELKKFSLLQGSLQITGLQNVMDIREADFANLNEKQRLEQLNLEWGDDDSNGSRNPSTEVQVLNSLRPHQNVSRLSVGSFGGTEFPSWIADPTFTNMVLLRLWNCKNVSSLPPLGRLPSLKDLEIKGMNGVKEVGAEFYGDGSSFASLETLKFSNMLGWEQWCNDLNDVNGEAAKKFPKLHKLYVSNCPKLVGKLPSCSCVPSHRELSISECQEGVLRSASDLSSLTTLEIYRISELVSLYEAHIEEMVTLQDLTIGDCEELKYLWKDGTNLDKLVCLKLLKVFNCKQLVSLVEGEEGQLPCNLQVLEISRCDNLKKLPNGLHSLKSLIDLKICGCGKLLSFPATGVPYCLRTLEISNCKSLRSSPNDEFPDSLPWNGSSRLENLYISTCPQLNMLPIHTLTSLTIDDCENLNSLPNKMQNLTRLSISRCKNLNSLPNPMQNLTFLSIYYCENLNSLPKKMQNLTSLSIMGCKILKSLPNPMQNLISLSICECKNLNSLPNPMQNLTFLYIRDCENLRSMPSPMQNFTALKSLEISNCGGTESFPEGGLPPNLTSLSINDCENLRQPMWEWGLHRLASLVDFKIWGPSPGIDMFDSFPDNDGLLLPTSLSRLWICELHNLKSISRGLLKLTSLQCLKIKDCPNLQSFPEEGLPATLEQLSIKSCPLLKERCSKDQKGSYWPFISHIPCIKIDHVFIQ